MEEESSMIAAALLALALSADPAQLRLGRDARARLRVEAPLQPVLTASVGRVEEIRRTAEGAYEADYIPPDEQLPQIAIISAVAGEEVAFIAIPLSAEGDAVVKTRPGGRISVRIGSEVFGPVIADQRGKAMVPVVVPPGVHEAHHGKRAIRLDVPPSRTLHVAFGPAGSADKPQTIPVYVVVVTAQGAPRRGAAIRLRASRGKLSALRERAPGLYEASLSLAAGATGEIRASASLDASRDFVAEAAIALGGGPADRIAISADRQSVHAEDPRARLHVSARDAFGNIPSDELKFESTAGEVRATPAGPGEWDLMLSLPPAFAGRDAVEVRVRGSKTRASRELPLLPGPLDSVAFEHPDAAMIADGATSLRIPLRLHDKYGNAVSNPRPELTVDHGRAELEQNGDALYANYVPPLLRERTDTFLSARAGAATARARVTLLPEVQTRAFSAKIGALSNLAGFSAPLLGVEGAWRTQRLGPEGVLSLEADYAHRGYSELLRVGATDALGESRVDLLLVHFSAGLRHRFGDRNTLWVSAGPTAAAYWTRVAVTSLPTRRGFAVAPGLQGAIGAERRFRFVVPFFEVRGGWINGSGLPILSGPLRTLTFMGGVRLETL
jgi:hypothetical protein